MACNPFELEAIAAIEFEPSARDAILRHHYQLPLNPSLCDNHYQQRLRGILPDSSILKYRALMPMCKSCAAIRVEELLDRNLPNQGQVAGCPIDTCICATNVMGAECRWCEIEEMGRLYGEYVNLLRTELFDENGVRVEGGGLWCLCGRPAVSFADETLRRCAICDGVVQIPCHALDGATHLTCMILQPSKFLTPTPQPECFFLGNNHPCPQQRHPVGLPIETLAPGALRSHEVHATTVVRELAFTDLTVTVRAVPDLVKVGAFMTRMSWRRREL